MQVIKSILCFKVKGLFSSFMSQEIIYQEDNQKFKWLIMLMSSVLMASFHPIFINLGKVNGKIVFSSASVALLIELSKLFFSVTMLLKDHLFKRNFTFLPVKVILLYSVPAALYSINNNLIIHIQLYMDPGSFQVLSNMKIAASAIFYKVIINRHVTSKKWLAVFLLFVAGLLNSLGGLNIEKNLSLKTVYVTKIGICLVCLYSAISGFAGVYTEAVLKTYSNTSIHVQNSILYLYGVLLNGLVYISMNESLNDFFNGFSLWIWFIVLTQAANGIIISYILKHSSTIVRLFISASSTVLTPFLSHFIFNVALNFYFLGSIIIVLFALCLHFI